MTTSSNHEPQHDRVAMQRLQQAFHREQYDYRAGSPHLRHWHLYEWLVGVTLGAMRSVSGRGVRPSVLEVGAGHGGYTEPLLAAGCQVTSTEMSEPSLERLRTRFGTNGQFVGIFDPDGSLEMLGNRRFGLILCSSVLHHIPDYAAFVIAAVRRHLEPGGAFVSLQDPLWYPRVGAVNHRADRMAYGAWRVLRGNYAQLVATGVRRLRGVYDETNPADMAEYHVVRQGVDEEVLLDLLRPNFTSVALTPYWSTQAPILQRGGQRVGLVNTFLIVADDYRAP